MRLRDMLIANGWILNIKDRVISKNGGAFLFFILILSLLLSSILVISFDITHSMRLSRNIDIALDVSAKAASANVDMDILQLGDVIVKTSGENNAFSVFRDMFERNFLKRDETGHVLHRNSSFVPSWEHGEEVYSFTSPSTGNNVRLYVVVNNDINRESITIGRAPYAVVIPLGDNPVVATLAVLTYNRVGILSEDPIIIRRVAVSQLNTR